MSGIPERGYGTWRQWRRRALSSKSDTIAYFYVTAGDSDDRAKWQESHMKFLPPEWTYFEQGTVREATDMQA